MERNQSGKILIVEDDTDSLNILLELLNIAGFHTFAATDGESAVEKAAAISPDLILLDVMLPGMDGFEVCRILKADNNLKDIPVIFITSLSEIVDKVRGFDAGGIDYITKPFQNEEVASRIITHISNRKLQKQLQESEERYRLLFNAMTEGFVLLDTICDENNQPVDYRFLEINPAFERLTRLKREDLVGRNVGQFFPDLKTFWIDICSSATLTGEPVRSGKYSSFLEKYYQVFAYSPVPLQCAVLFMDITEQKQAEDVLKRDKVVIENLVQERTSELLGVQLELEKSKRLSEIGTLAAIIAHELRNPLAAIGMATYNIKQKANNPNIENNLANIDKKISESEQIINNLLNYSRIKLPHYEKVVIFSLLEECMENTYNNTPKKISFEKDLASIKDIPIEADAYQLHEIFCNILNNAIDAVPDSTGKILIKAENKEANLEVCIQDNGCGIDKDHLARVFDPFFTTKARGTGLGLSICRQIINLHNGTIDIQSEPGKGTTVTVHLPNNSRTDGNRIISDH